MGVLATFVLTGCLIMEETGRDFPGDSAPVGYARIQLTLEKNQSALGKSAANDTTFQLDSLIMVFSASGASTVRVAQPISGRADTGVIAVSAPPVALPGLRNWTARIYTIDERVNPARRDTVHLDSVVFAVRPADTAVVQKAVSPAFAILKVRIVSNNQSQVPDSVRFVRLRVDGVVRDSQVVGSAPATATLNWVQAMPTGNIVHAVGNLGRVLRSTNSGVTWTEVRMPEEQHLVSGFVSGSEVYNISRTGLLRWSTDGGVTWPEWQKNQVTTSTSDTLRRMYFASSVRGYAVGRNGSIYGINNKNDVVKTTSNTTHHLNGVYFPSTNVGYVVGENETILKTTNANVSWMGNVVWQSVSGGWFHQTSAAQGSPVNSVHFLSPTVGRAFLNNGYLTYTANGGATWTRISNQGTSEHIYDGQHVSPTIAYFVGAKGTFRKSVNAEQMHASWGQLHADYRVPTSIDLLALHFINPDTGLMVGTGGAVYRTQNGTMAIGDGGANRVVVTAMTSGTTRTLRGVRFVSRTIAVAVGDSGTILRSTNTGGSWNVRTSGTTERLTGVSFANESVGYVSGHAGTILKTIDGGNTWTTLTSGTGVNLLSVSATSPTTIYVSGAGGVIRKSVDGGETWFVNDSPTMQTIRKLHFYNAETGFAVGDSGVVLNAINYGENWTGGGVKRSLKAVHFVNVSTGWVVGEDGIILKTSDSGRVWVEQHRQTGLMLHAVHFQNASTGWVTGATGEVFKTTNGGTTWTQQATIVTTIPLTWISFRNTSEGFIIGGSNSLYSTNNGGTTWNALFAGGMPGARIFDEVLTYKYLKPGKPHTILVEAIDRAPPSLRGYQSSFVLTVGAGQDTTILQPLTRCGHNGSSPCQ